MIDFLPTQCSLCFIFTSSLLHFKSTRSRIYHLQHSNINFNSLLFFKKSFIYLFERREAGGEKDRDKESESYLLFAGSLLKCSQEPDVSQAKSRSWEFHLVTPIHHPRRCLSGKPHRQLGRWDLKWYSCMGCQHHQQELCHNASPQFVRFFSFF